MKNRVTALTIVAAALAPHAVADVTPVRSSLESTANVSLTVVELSDEQTDLEDQGATTNPLGPVFAGASLSTSDGVFESSTTGTVMFTDASDGSFSADSSFSGVQSAKDPDAQRLGVTLNTTFQYDFFTTETGTVNFSGTIFNGGISIVSYFVNVRFNKETTPGGGFNGSGIQHQILDTDHDGNPLTFHCRSIHRPATTASRSSIRTPRSDRSTRPLRVALST